jgi:hypothetical protein
MQEKRHYSDSLVYPRNLNRSGEKKLILRYRRGLYIGGTLDAAVGM